MPLLKKTAMTISCDCGGETLRRRRYGMVERLGCIIACIWMTISYRGRTDVRTGETSILATAGGGEWSAGEIRGN